MRNILLVTPCLLYSTITPDPRSYTVGFPFQLRNSFKTNPTSTTMHDKIYLILTKYIIIEHLAISRLLEYFLEL